jgi:hypothetical protein
MHLVLLRNCFFCIPVANILYIPNKDDSNLLKIRLQLKKFENKGKKVWMLAIKVLFLHPLLRGASGRL